MVSLPSPTSEARRSQSVDDVDISRVRLSRNSRSGLAGILPETLRIGSPTSPSTRSYNPFRSSTKSYELLRPLPTIIDLLSAGQILGDILREERTHYST